MKNNKKTWVIAGALSAVIYLAGCSSSSTNASVVGTWTEKSRNVILMNGGVRSDTTTQTPPAQATTIEYKADGHTNTTTPGIGSYTGSYTVSGTTLTSTTPMGGTVVTTITTLDAHTLTIQDKNPDTTYSIPPIQSIQGAITFTR